MFPQTITFANILQFMAALMMAFVWAAYLRKINVFARIKWWQVVISFAMGALTTLPILYINFPEIPRPEDEPEVIKKLIFYVYDVALHEETFKFLGFIIIYLAFSGWFRDEPNFIVHASLVALGFATVENFIYFSNHGIHLVYMRGMVSTFSHMIDTSIVVGFMVIGLRKNMLKAILFTLLGLIIASLTHGIYNYFIAIGDNVNSNAAVVLLFVLSMLIFILEIEIWSTLFNNFLNFTRRIEQNKSIDRNPLQIFLFIAFFAAGAIQLVGLIDEEGLKTGLTKNFRLLLQEVIITVILVVRITRFTIIPRYWKPVYPWFPVTLRRDVVQRSLIPGSPRFILKIRGDEFNEYPFTSAIGKEVELKSLPQKSVDFDISIKIKMLGKKFLGKGGELYYLAEIIDFHTIDPQYNSRFVLLRPKHYGKKRWGNKKLVGVIALKGFTDTEKITLSDGKFIKWMLFDSGPQPTFVHQVISFIA